MYVLHVAHHKVRFMERNTNGRAMVAQEILQLSPDLTQDLRIHWELKLFLRFITQRSSQAMYFRIPFSRRRDAWKV